MFLIGLVFIATSSFLLVSLSYDNILHSKRNADNEKLITKIEQL